MSTGTGRQEQARCRIVISADDFGMSADINRAIILAFERGLISDTSIMANMPGFGEACELTHRYGLHGRVGLHLNLSEGSSLTHPIRAHRRFSESSGAFRRRHRIAVLLRGERRAVECELDAQIDACLRRGLRPAHLNSHHHYHTEWPIGSIVIGLARRHGIASVRMTRNCGEKLGIVTGLYKLVYNHRLRVSGLTKVAYFGPVDQVVRVAAGVSGVCEVNVHPGFDRRGVVVDRLTGEALESVVHRLCRVAVVELMRQSPAAERSAASRR